MKQRRRSSGYCFRSPCHNGWCEETREGFKCHCPPGLQGPTCDETIDDEIDDKRMSTDGVTVPIETVMHALPEDEENHVPTAGVSVPIATGTSASLAGVECGSVICVNGGQCDTNEDNQLCQCPLGYEGKDCGTVTEPLTTRLFGGHGAYEGRVEVFYNGSWGTVCDDGWNITNAHVVCRSLGYTRAVYYYTSAYSGDVTGGIIFDDMKCTGTETNIAFCSNSGYAIHNCSDFQHIGVNCDGMFEHVECGPEICVNGGECHTTGDQLQCHCPFGYKGEDCSGIEPLKTRLIGGREAYQGRVEVYYNGSWGTVCDDRWNITNAHVVCRSLGYTRAVYYYPRAWFGQGTGDIIIDNLDCTGNESNVAFCSHSSYTSHNCWHSEDVSVTCDGIEPLETRLVGGNGAYQGRVEVFYDGSWGTVCDDGWSITNAHVVCRSLGYTRALNYYPQAEFGQGTGDIIIDDVECTGTESNIAFCSNIRYTIHNCRHQEDVSVTCDRSANGDDSGIDMIFVTDTNEKGIYVAELGIYAFTELNTGDDPIEAWDISFDSTNQKLYWTNKGDDKIYSGNWDMTERVAVSSETYSDPTSISIDETTGQIFCAFFGDGVITRIDLNDTDTEVVVISGLTGLRAIEVDANNRYLYFTQTGRVDRWRYDQVNHVNIYTDDALGEIDGIAINVPGNLIVVCDYGNSKVITMALDGSNPHVVSILSSYKITDVMVYLGNYYLIDADSEMEVIKYYTETDSLESVFSDSSDMFGFVKKIHVARVQVPE